MTALEIINGAADLIGIRGVAFPVLSAADTQQCFRRLNGMVNAWLTMPLTMLTVTRQIFNLTANQQSYSIGLGAEFNVPRPQAVSGAALLLNGLTAAQAVTITRSGTTATVTLTSHGVSVGEEVLIAGADDPEYNGLVTVLTVPTSDTFTYQVFNSPVSPAAGSPTMQQYESTPPVEIPRSMLTDDAYQAVQLKGQTNSQFTNVYYNPSQPYGTVWLWPIPNTNQNQLVLYLQDQFTGFADLTTDYTFPDMPGYGEALEYNLAMRIAAPFGKQIAQYPEVVTLAAESLGRVMRQNYRLMDLPIDPALTKSRVGGYNINTGNL